jgi:hypothetical protein
MKWFSFYTVQGDTEQDKIAKALADTPEATAKIGKYFYDTTSKLMKSNSFTLVGSQVHGVDIVRDVLRVVPTMWAAANIVSYLFHRLIASYLFIYII